MKLLAIDTSSNACTVAVQSGATIVERHEEQPREHTRILLPMVRSAIEEANTRLAELDAIVLGNGPGSFIGMRIAASVAQGLAFASGLKIIPVSSLAAVAAEVFSQQETARVVVTQDAHMDQVYLGIFQRGDSGLPEAQAPERISAQVRIDDLDADADGHCTAAGAGWQRYPELLDMNRDRITVVSEVMFPRARYLLGLGAAGLADSKELDPKDVSPRYLRQKVAEKPAQSS